MPDDQRLIEDYIPIEAISAEATQREVYPQGPHLDVAPVVGTPAIGGGAGGRVWSVGSRAERRQGAQGSQRVRHRPLHLPGPKGKIAEAQRNILAAHAERLTAERIGAGLAPAQATSPSKTSRQAARRGQRVLDMFAGGGAIPLEALRLGCEAYTLDLNPVAHLIELCTLVYPQQYGAPDPAARGSAADGTWAGLAAEVEHWGKWVLERVKAEIGDLYPPIPDPNAQPAGGGQLAFDHAAPPNRGTPGMLTPVAYLWTRTVRCKNPACGGTVPLAQAVLAGEEGRPLCCAAAGCRDEPR